MKTDANGWAYYDKLPDGFRLAGIDDFIEKGKVKIGMMFLIKWISKEYYQVCKVSENLTSKFLIPFIDDKRVFIHE
jgi:hypothetical protein